MAEQEDAVRLANRILDQPGRDPDDDLSVLARQLLRWRERAQPEEDWLPIATAPRTGELVDLWADGERLPDCFWHAPEWADADEHGWRQKYAETSTDCSFAVEGVTHWRRKPGPPPGLTAKQEQQAEAGEGA